MKRLFADNPGPAPVTNTTPIVELHPARLRLQNFPPDVMEALRRTFSWAVPGAHFQMKRHREKHPTPQEWCKACRWDGKRCLIEPDGSMPRGFELQVLAYLLAIKGARPGLDWQIADFCGPDQPPLYQWHLKAELRDYQQGHVTAALEARRGILQAATGAGKSIMAAALVCELGLPAIIVVPTKLLAGQFLETLRKFSDCEVGLIGSGKCEDAPVQVAIAKSLVAADGTTHAALQTKSVLIIDEMHLSSSTTWEAICNACPATYRYGFSATPYRKHELEDNLLLGLCGPIIAEIGVEELQEQGHLAQTEIRIIRNRVGYARMIYDEETDENGLPIGWRETTYGERYRAAIVRNGYRNKLVADLVNYHVADGAKVLVVVSWIEHADELLPLFDREAMFLSGKDSAKRTEEKRIQFGQQQGGCCIGTGIVDTGFDVPSIDVLILAGGGEYDGRQTQRLGRGLRPSPGKDRVLIYDFRDDDRPLFDYHSKARVTAYEKLGQACTEYETVALALAADSAEQQQALAF